jgi:hypothetical protein
MLRTDLVRRLPPFREQHIHQILTLQEMGDRKPFQFLRHLRILTLDVLDNILRCIWSNRLPSNVQAILTGQPKGDLDAATAVQTPSLQNSWTSLAPTESSAK